MKIVFIFLFSLVFFTSLLSAQKGNSFINISDVQIKNSWFIVFDNYGKRISQMPQSKNEIVAVASSFFVITNNGWIITYDAKCKKISQMPQSKKQVKGAVGDTFTVYNNGWIITYDNKCKEKNRRLK